MTLNRAMPAKLFIRILKVKDVHLKERLEKKLISDLGPSDHRMILVPSDGTIHSVFLSFDRLIETENVPTIREILQSFEKEYSAKLVVGYVDNRRVVVWKAADKDDSEEVIQFKDGGIQFLPKAHFDFRHETAQEFFLSMRKIYRAQLRSMCLLRK
jgi:hypothetical protein